MNLLSSSKTNGKRNVLVHGLPYFGNMFAQIMNSENWQFRFYPDHGIGNFAALAWQLSACDIAYQIGGRVTAGKFLWAAKQLKKRKVVMHWAGSDTLDERCHVALGKSDPWVTKELCHWAESEWMVKEVQDLGIACERVPLPSSTIPERVSPLPSKFSVLVHMPSVYLGYLYGLDRILQVSRNLPHISFELVGLKVGRIQGAPGNLRIYGRVADLSDFYRRATILWRPVRHDGLSFMVREALGHGRHVLYTYPLPGCVKVNDAKDAQKEIERLYRWHELGQLRVNQVGHQMVREQYAAISLKQQILTRLELLLQS